MDAEAVSIFQGLADISFAKAILLYRFTCLCRFPLVNMVLSPLLANVVEPSHVHAIHPAMDAAIALIELMCNRRLPTLRHSRS
jgi:hypothetical protein